MFLNNQDKKQTEYYEEMLQTIGSLSRLFSESDEPYLHYRIAENLFCKSFEAENLSRTDCSADATKNRLGIGIKTFTEKNGSSMQKVAEFNSKHLTFSTLDAESKIRKIAELRNERIATTKKIFDLDELIYHCITRKNNGMLVYETPMDLIDIENIKNVVEKGNSINFEDGRNEYSFYSPKSTLLKRFSSDNVLMEFHVTIAENPFDTLESLFKKTAIALTPTSTKPHEHIVLPLYSMKAGEKVVAVKSGLNQWNASGRRRDPDEAYIQIPSWIHKKYPGFFPPRDISFTLLLPDGKQMDAKVCQDNSKALMSNPNSALGEWLLRTILGLKEKELLTYEKLDRIGLDSVVIYKTSEGKYDIDFTKIGSYESFKGENNITEDEQTED